MDLRDGEGSSARSTHGDRLRPGVMCRGLRNRPMQRDLITRLHPWVAPWIENWSDLLAGHGHAFQRSEACRHRSWSVTRDQCSCDHGGIARAGGRRLSGSRRNPMSPHSTDADRASRRIGGESAVGTRRQEGRELHFPTSLSRSPSGARLLSEHCCAQPHSMQYTGHWLCRNAAWQRTHRTKRGSYSLERDRWSS